MSGRNLFCDLIGNALVVIVMHSDLQVFLESRLGEKLVAVKTFPLVVNGIALVHWVELGTKL